MVHVHHSDGFFKCLIKLVPNVFKVVPPRLILDLKVYKLRTCVFTHAEELTNDTLCVCVCVAVLCVQRACNVHVVCVVCAAAAVCATWTIVQLCAENMMGKKIGYMRLIRAGHWSWLISWKPAVFDRWPINRCISTVNSHSRPLETLTHCVWKQKRLFQQCVIT